MEATFSAIRKATHTLIRRAISDGVPGLRRRGDASVAEEDPYDEEEGSSETEEVEEMEGDASLVQESELVAGSDLIGATFQENGESLRGRGSPSITSGRSQQLLAFQRLAANKNWDDDSSPEVMRALEEVEHLEDVNVRDSRGNTPMHYAVYSSRVTAKLLEKGGDPNVMNTNGLAPLHIAARIGRSDTVEALLGAGAEAGVQTSDGMTAHDIASDAARNGRSSMRVDGDRVLQELVRTTSRVSRSELSSIEDPLSFTLRGFVDRVDSNGENWLELPDSRASDDCPSLLVAVEQGRSKEVKEMLENEVDVTLEDSHGNTVLHYAVAKGSSSMVKALLGTSVDVNQRNTHGATALDIAVRWSRKTVCEILVNSGKADFKSPCPRYGITPLHIAVANTSIFNMLVNAGANLAAPCRTQEGISATPLHLVALHDRAGVVLDALATNPFVDVEDDMGNTPLFYCRSTRVARLFVEAGANVNHQNHFGVTPLHVATHSAQQGIVTMLLSENADPDITSSKGYTAYEYSKKYMQGSMSEIAKALTRSQKKFMKERKTIMKMLATNVTVLAQSFSSFEEVRAAQRPAGSTTGALSGTPDSRDDWLMLDSVDVSAVDENGRTLLHNAVINNHVGEIETLVHAGANVNALCGSGSTPLHWASSETAAHTLVSAGADLRAQDSDGMTPLHRAIQKRQVGVVRYFVTSCTVDLAIEDVSGRSPVALAATLQHDPIHTIVKFAHGRRLEAVHFYIRNGDSNSLDRVLQFGVDFSVMNGAYDTPLHSAVLKCPQDRRVSVIEAIVPYQDVNTTNSNGLTPLHCAVAKEDTDCCILFLEHGANPCISRGWDHNASTPLSWAFQSSAALFHALLEHTNERFHDEIRAEVGVLLNQSRSGGRMLSMSVIRRQEGGTRSLLSRDMVAVRAAESWLQSHPSPLQLDDMLLASGERIRRENGDDEHDEEDGDCDTCAICLVELQIEEEIQAALEGERIDAAYHTLTLICNHTFHKECIEQWLSTKTTCPMCRCVVVKDQPNRSHPMVASTLS